MGMPGPDLNQEIIKFFIEQICKLTINLDCVSEGHILLETAPTQGPQVPRSIRQFRPYNHGTRNGEIYKIWYIALKYKYEKERFPGNNY